MSEGSFNSENTRPDEGKEKSSTEASDEVMSNIWGMVRGSWKLAAGIGATQLAAVGIGKLTGIADVSPLPGALALGGGTGLLALDSARSFAARKIDEIKTKRNNN